MARKFLNGIDVQSNRIVNVASPSSSTDGVNKAYVDALINGLAWKNQYVRAATTTNGTLSTAYANGQTIDGVTLATNDSILIKNQTTQTENGIYTVNASGAPTRRADATTGAQMVNATVVVSEGTTNADTAWTCTTNAPITVGTTNLAFGPVAGGTTYTNGAGLSLSGTTFSVNAGNGIIADGSSTRVDPAVVVRKYATNIGDGSSTSFTKAHGLATGDLTVAVYLIGTPSEEVDVDVDVDSTNVYLTFATAPAAAAYRLVAHG